MGDHRLEGKHVEKSFFYSKSIYLAFFRTLMVAMVTYDLHLYVIMFTLYLYSLLCNLSVFLYDLGFMVSVSPLFL